MRQRRLEADMMRFNAVMHARRGGVFLLCVLKKRPSSYSNVLPFYLRADPNENSPLLNIGQASHQSRVPRLKPRLNHCRCLRLLSMTHLPHGKLDSVFFVFCVSLLCREIIRPGIPIPMYCVFVFRAHPNENSPPPLNVGPSQSRV